MRDHDDQPEAVPEQQQQQQRDAQRLEAMGRLAGAVAHDFNNIMTAIMGSACLLERQLHDPEAARRLAREIGNAANRGAELARQLLTFGQRQPTNMQPLDLGATVESALLVLRRLLGPTIELETGLSRGCVVTGDRAMIGQVVMNLALNARDAMPAGGRLTIGVVPSARNPAFVELSVTDTGVGIAPSDLPRVFEPFFTTKGADGFGIGLSTVYGIVGQHGGGIEVESALGAGTRFRICLPRTQLAAQTGETLPPPFLLAERKLTVLLVDDEEPVRSVVAQLLALDGHHVLQAEDSVSAQAIWAEYGSAIDVLLADVVLKGPLDGPRLSRGLQGERSDLPVILMSGLGTNQCALEQVPGCHYLQKPFGLLELRAVLTLSTCRSAADDRRTSAAHAESRSS